MSAILSERWFTRGRPPQPLATLFPAATQALLVEDQALFKLISACPRGREPEHGEHPGLAFGLFETTLVYLLFKAWLPHADIEWEARYSDGDARRADLVVARPRLYFEAKWWGSMHGKVLGAMSKDVGRLREPKDADGRYLLTFWWNFDEDYAEDEQAIDELDKHLGEDGLRPRYLSRFRTSVRHKRDGDAYFAMCAFEVR